MHLVQQSLAPCRTSTEKHDCPACASCRRVPGLRVLAQQQLQAISGSLLQRLRHALQGHAPVCAAHPFAQPPGHWLQCVAADVLDTTKVMPEARSCLSQNSVYAQVNKGTLLLHLGAPPSCQHSCSSVTPSPNPQSLQHAAQGLLIMHGLLTSVELEGACCSTSSSSGLHHGYRHDSSF